MPLEGRYIFVSCGCSSEDCNFGSEKCSISTKQCEGTKIANALVSRLKDKGIKAENHIKKINIFGLDSYQTIIKVLPENVVYVNIKEDQLDEIVKEHFIGGKVVEKYTYKSGDLGYIDPKDEPFYHKQYRIVLRNSGIIDPESIDDYLCREGYKGLARSISELTPDEVIGELKESGLRGRGGGGFPTWMKWNFAKGAPGDKKYVICNADEGDPGAYMDRSVLEGDPHSVIEGMAIGAYTVGAQVGYIYCRAEYPLAIRRLEKAIADAKECGVLGNNILGTDFSFDIEVRLGAGAFVCGEETALIASIEGERGEPRPRPPFPAVKGLLGNSSMINNVETLANIPIILVKGGKWYSSIGTKDSKGTKVFALTGKVKNSGLLEVPMGTTLRDIIFDIGGGIEGEERKFKAAQTGGPSGGVIPPEYLDTPISYESLNELGSIMGSGGLIVMDDTDCMVDVAQFYLQFTVDESCGKCTPCRIGGKQMLGILENIANGNGKESDLQLMEDISATMRNASLCGLGMTAANPVCSTLRYFKEEYLEHIFSHKCRAGKCTDLISYTIDKEKCIGCTLCARACPANCIAGSVKNPHVIDQNECVKCGECFSVCKFDAVIKG